MTADMPDGKVIGQRRLIEGTGAEEVMDLTGLTDAEVSERIENGQTNTQTDPSAKTTKQIIRENTLTYFNLIFLFMAVLCLIAGSYRSLTFLPVIIANTLIGIFQELHAKKILDQLSLMNQPTAAVIRDGRKQNLPVQDLVQDDIVELAAGNQIPADAVVIRGKAAVNEALLTGEADEIEKTEGSDLLSGSFVVSGTCYARLTAVGDESYIAGLTARAKAKKGREESEMVRSINRLVIFMGVAIIPLGIALFYQSFFVNGQAFRESVESMVAALIGIIPEGMYLLVSVALAVSAGLLARQHVMLHDMKSTETLARVDILCVDKTGTITDNSMLVADVIPADPDGEAEKQANLELLRRYITAIPDDNLSMKALRQYLPAKSKDTADRVIPFASSYKYGSVVFGKDQYLLGAPEAVLGSRYPDYREKIEGYADRGLRVMVFALYEGPDPLDRGEKLDDCQLTKPILYCLLENPIRKTAPETFSYFAKQGVQVKVISGDHAMTVSRVAEKAQIEGADRFIDASVIANDHELEEAAEKYTVFGRTTPEQKEKLVAILQKKGHKVAMTGDGVNDILAMKRADCSIAMAAGADAAAQAAQVVLLDSDFSHMPGIVAEGRKTVNNIQRSSTLFLVKNIFSLLLSVFSIVSVISYPLVPSQISLISAFNIGIPAFFLALEKNERRIEGKFLPAVLFKALPAALTNFFVIAAMVVFGSTFHVSENDVSVAATFLMAIVGFMILLKLSEPMNIFHGIVLAGCMVGFAVCAYFFHDVFAITRVSKECVMLFVVFAIATEPIMRYLTRGFEWTRDMITGLRHRAGNGS